MMIVIIIFASSYSFLNFKLHLPLRSFDFLRSLSPSTLIDDNYGALTLRISKSLSSSSSSSCCGLFFSFSSFPWLSRHFFPHLFRSIFWAVWFKKLATRIRVDEILDDASSSTRHRVPWTNQKTDEISLISRKEMKKSQPDWLCLVGRRLLLLCWRSDDFRARASQSNF